MNLIVNPREKALEAVIEHVAALLLDGTEGGLVALLDGADLQPTPEAARLAAVAAVAVLFAHDVGTGVTPRGPKAGGGQSDSLTPPVAQREKQGWRLVHICPHCKKPFQTRGRLQTHIQKYHSDSV